MAAGYTKLDFKAFKERLSANQYQNATGARRGVGKSGLSADEKAQAYKMIDKHFGTTSAAPPKAAPAAKVSAKKAAPAAKVEKAGAKGRTSKKTAPVAKKGGRPRKTDDAPGASSDREELETLNAGVMATRNVIAGLHDAKSVDVGLDISATLAEGSDLLRRSMQRIHSVLGDRLPSAVATAAPEEEPESHEPEEEEEAEPEGEGTEEAEAPEGEEEDNDE